MSHSPPTRRSKSLRFSLRTLLVLTALPASVIAWGANAHRVGKRHEQIGVALTQLGCYPAYSHEEIGSQVGFITGSQVITEVRSTLPAFVQRLGLTPVFRRVEMISIGPGAEHPERISELIEELGSLKSLGVYIHLVTADHLATSLTGKRIERLYLRGCLLPETELPWLNIDGLDWITIEYTDFSNPAIKNLPVSLTEVNIIDAKVSNDGLQDFQRLANLKSLKLHQTKVTMAGAESLRKSMPWCEIEWKE